MNFFNKNSCIITNLKMFIVYASYLNIFSYFFKAPHIVSILNASTAFNFSPLKIKITRRGHY